MKRFLKWLGIILLGIIILGLIIAAFVPNEFKYTRSIDINKPQSEVYEYLRFIKNQDNYGVWQLSDPNMIKSYEGEDGTVGFKYAWKSKEMGDGTQTITSLSAPTNIVTSLDFGFGEPATATFVVQNLNENKCKVSWGIVGKSPYPFNIMSLFFDMGTDFEKGLSNLKEVLE